MAAGGAVPFTVDGWQAHNGDLEYLGTLTKDDQTITAHQYGSRVSHIFLEPDDQ
jgi:hypothetical protein